MSKLSNMFLLYLSLLLLMTNCRNKDIDEYYQRPSTLADPIYQQLEARGKFKSFLKLIDRCNYKDILSTGGYWTCFAPNDSAFNVYLAENSLSSINDVDSVTASKIVRYMLVYDSYDSARLDDYQNSGIWTVNNAFRRKSAYYKWVYDFTFPAGETLNGQSSVKVMDAGSVVNYLENNNKYLPYFTQKYFNAKGLLTSDYTYFYPKTTFMEMNVMDANVVGTGVFAENGYFYEINKVILPQPNIYEYLNSKSDYSEFAKRLETFATYTKLTDFQTRYLEATGKSDVIYHKYFPSLAFSPNWESFLRETSTDAQSDCWSLFVPTNDAFIDYEKNVLAEFYDHDPDKISNSIMAEFINAHMWQTAVWPSKLKKTGNFFGEAPTFETSNILEGKMLSNGMLYGLNRVHAANTFNTVYAYPFLNPNYSFMIRLMGSSFKQLLTVPGVRYTVFVVNDNTYVNRGFSYNSNLSQWELNGAASLSNMWVSTAGEKLTRDLNLQIVTTPNDELNNLNGEGIIKSYGGECIKFKNNQVWSSGNADTANTAGITGYRDYTNGRVYFINKLMEYSERSPVGHLRILAGYSPTTGKLVKPTQFYNFYRYILLSGLVSDTSDLNRATITGVSSGDYYTFFVPTSDSLIAAVSKGLIPDYHSITDENRSTVQAMILYHIANKIIIANGDEEDSGTTKTAYKDLDGITHTITINNIKYNMVLRDEKGESFTLIREKSDNLSSMSIIHLLNGFFKRL